MVHVKRCEMDARITGRVMCEGRQRIAIGLRNIKHVRATKPMGASTVGFLGRVIVCGHI
jgi:hypothetical protein